MDEVGDGFGGQLFDATDRDALPAQTVAVNLGCGNPLAVAEPNEGETVPRSGCSPWEVG